MHPPFRNNNDSKRCLTCFSSGTGLAGVFGFLWKYLWNDWLRFTLKQTLCMALVLVVVYTWVYVRNLWTFDSTIKPSTIRQEGMELVEEEDGIIKENVIVEEENDDGDAPECLSEDEPSETPSVQLVQDMSPTERFKLVLSLYPYMIPLFLVYAAEYALQSGTWSAIGFPVTDVKARDAFFEYSNWMVCFENMTTYLHYLFHLDDSHYCIPFHLIFIIVSSRCLFITIIGNDFYSSNVHTLAHAPTAMHQCCLFLDCRCSTCLLQLLVVGAMFLCGLVRRCRLCQWLFAHLCRFASTAPRIFTQCHQCRRRIGYPRGRCVGTLFTILSLSTQWTEWSSCILSNTPLLTMYCTVIEKVYYGWRSKPHCLVVVSS